MQNLFRAAAEALENLADKAHEWADWSDGDQDASSERFAGIDIVGIDFSTSIQRVAGPVIQGWERYCRQAELLRRDHGIRAFGVNAVPFPLTPKPVSARRLPRFAWEHFRPRGFGRGLIEYGSAFYDFFFVAIGQVQQLGVFDDRAHLPVSIALLSDGSPNGGNYRADDVRPLIEAARARGVRFRLIVISQSKYLNTIRQFSRSLGLAPDDVEIVWDDGAMPSMASVSSAFEMLSGC